MKTKNYYKVQAKCGHVGRHKYILKNFYVIASSAKNAARKVRYKPRVKHHHKDAIKSVKRIDYDEYMKGIKTMANDMYFNVHNSQDQKLYNCVKQEEIYFEEKGEKRKKLKVKQKLLYEIMSHEAQKIMRGVLYGE